MAQVYILTGKRKGTTVQLMGRYNFVDGVMVVESDDHAKMIKANMEFYAAKAVDLDLYNQAKAAGKDPLNPIDPPAAVTAPPAKNDDSGKAPAK